LAEGGANVVVAARREDRLAEVARDLARYEGGVLAQRCDVSDPADVRAMVEAAWERFGRVDILVNNAGVAADAGVVPEKDLDELFAQTMATNVNGTFWCCREVAARQLADGKGGSLINIASVAGLAGQENFPPAYPASKAAVINLTRTLAVSWGDRGVRVNAIAPGWFPSEMTDPWFAAQPFFERIVGQAALRRIGDPEELGGALLFLASDASSFVTGQTIVVDGGLSAHAGAAPLSDAVLDVFAAAAGELGTRILPGG
jgi:NAD(P)-dependent dehydrogenase (short-subunit alcohol dehydrogenase family)